MSPTIPPSRAPWPGFEFATAEDIVRLQHGVQITSSLDLYRSSALMVGVAEKTPMYFASQPGGGLLIASRGFLGTEVGSLALLEPQGTLTPATQEVLLELFENAQEPMCMTCVSRAFLETYPELVSRFEVHEVPELAEYRYFLEEWATMAGAAHYSRRRYAAKIEREQTCRVVAISADHLEACELVSERWHLAKATTGVTAMLGETGGQALEEDEAAFKNALAHWKEFGLFGWLFLSQDASNREPLGFMIFEHLRDGVVGGRFGKAGRQPQGLSSFMERESAKLLLGMGYSILNADIDAGVPGLRFRKQQARPHELAMAHRLVLKGAPKR